MDFVARNTCHPREAWGEVAVGDQLHGLSDGSWSFIDAIEEIVERWGPGGLVVSTWIAEGKDIDRAEYLLTSQKIEWANFLLDRSFMNRRPQYLAALREKFGDAAIRIWKCHAKFALLRGRENILYLTSANLNRNPRIENYTLLVGGEVVDEYFALVQDAFRLQAVGEGFAATGQGDGLHLSRKTLGPAGSRRMKPTGDQDMELLRGGGQAYEF